ncbi:hypothetical protein [Tomitella biformata]|uniref:hypothetical protein n=1 Tax=Tomitella biformata TaxID=630403 RepID=UPI000464E7FF|nr:hypothetical protein [Tomitella biformata]
MDNEKPALLYRSDAVLDGATDSQLRSRRRTGELVHLTRGSYLLQTDYGSLNALGRHRARISAVAHRHGEDAVISHVSAAAMHGYDLWDVHLDAVHLSQAGPANGKRRHGVHRHREQLAPGEIVSVGGILVTSAARTIADLARTVSLKSAVVTGDCALRRGLPTAALVAEVAAAKGRHGAPNARHALALMDGRSESVGESLSRLKIRELRLPAPELQKDVWNADREWLGRADFYFPGHAVVGEFDGKVKYGKYLKTGQAAGDAVYQEKVREDRIRDTGLVVVRWVWDDLRQPHILHRRICAAFERRRRAILLNPALADL